MLYLTNLLRRRELLEAAIRSTPLGQFISKVLGVIWSEIYKPIDNGVYGAMER
jgi:hypothetical protein